MQKIVNYSFGTTAIGAIAEKTINRLRATRVLGHDDLIIAAQIDDEFIRELLVQK
jgi:hypothetical protein